MEIKSLYRVIKYVREMSDNSSVKSLLSQIYDLVNEASNKPDEDFSTAIHQKKKELQSCFIKNDPVHWGYESYSLFMKINSGKLLGKKASDHLEEILTLDYKSAASEIRRFSEQYFSFIENLNSLGIIFDSIIPEDQLAHVDNDKMIMSLFLYFEGPLKIKSIAELERYSRLWDGILESFSKLTAESISPLDIFSFNSGNTVLGVKAGERTIRALMEGVSGILDSLPATLKIRQLQQDISALNLSKSINELLDKEIINCLDNSSYMAAREISEKYSSGEHNEQLIMEISRSLKQVLSFIEKGGRLEFDSPDFDDAGTANRLLNETLNLLQDAVN